ncbi:MAG: DEAD/DEAH box helicase, partial [Anaerolineae bacterium]|nr:DEAD/DEAH box helicase [Anaerolineae bacterium]
DAVMFLSAKNSQVDVVQSVGRVMRKAPNKKYGYIVIPVVVPADMAPEEALNDNKRYKVVWTVLNALRAHDDRFNATVNKIELNKRRPSQINVVGAGGTDDGSHQAASSNLGQQLELQFETLQNVMFARMVQKVGDRRYWEQWAKDVAVIAERQTERIEHLIKTRESQQVAFANFVDGLQKNINPSITEAQAVDMLAQHIITKPIFEALFEGYSFVQHNAVSQAMQGMLDALEERTLPEDSEKLQRFYDSVKKRAAGIDNAEGKQKIIVELYDKFFSTAFPKMVEQLGIVYTPVEAVDFIIRSVDDILKQEFGRSLSDENIHILDPFTGTGTFMVRLLQSGLINEQDLERKYKQELHANEIVLLAYYIAAVNIENAYHDATPDPEDGAGKASYTPFDGIVLTDSFQLGETGIKNAPDSEMFVKNSARVLKQKKAPLRVIMGNPPYSVGQRSANDNAQNQKYDFLDARIADTYAKATNATNKNSLYDSYIKAFRWSTDRLDPEHGGMIAFISNGGWLDANSMDGFRKVLEKEFSSIWVFNLRGNQRTSGELSRKEGGKIFGSGSRTPITITLLVKNPAKKSKKAAIHYHDIGDYLDREQKLAIIKDFASATSPEMAWKRIKPNKHGDWVRQRSDAFEIFLELTPEKKFVPNSNSYFMTNSNGLQTNRDAWVYNSSHAKVEKSISILVKKYNKLLKQTGDKDEFIDSQDQVIKWSSSLVSKFNSGLKLEFDADNIRHGIYRPFFKQFIYRDDDLNHRPYQLPKIFPTANQSNLLICVAGVGVTKGFSAIITDTLPDLELIGKSQCYPLYYYEEQDKQSPTLFDYANQNESDYIRRDGVSDFILGRAKKQYGVSTSSTTRLTKEDIFY